MINTIFPERESKLLEFKSKVPKFDVLIKTCIAFANAAGGRIIIGVDDISRKVVGASDDDRTNIFNNFPNSLYDSVSPSLIAQIYEQNFGKHSVLIIEIPVSPKKPYFLKNKDVSKGTYIRVGSSTRRATDEYIEDLTREAHRISYDEEIINVTFDTLSKDLLHDFYGSKTTKKRLLADKIIAVKPANKEHYCTTVAGILMFSEAPHNYLPEALVRCTRFKGVEGRDILRTEDITGTLEQQATESLKLVINWVATHYELRGVKLTGQIPVPTKAIREAIINALLHQKYTIPGAMKIAIYDNRIEIFNPGCFPGLVDINSLGDGTTYLRNPTLVRLAYQVNLIEARGTGIRLIYESCKKAGIKKPVYHEEGDFVKVIFYFEPDITSHENEETAIQAFMKLQQNVTAQQVANFLSVSRNTAIRKLNRLMDSKHIKKIGKGPSVKYSLRRCG
jgi:ATP-dependent DNA helicase RecG